MKELPSIQSSKQFPRSPWKMANLVGGWNQIGWQTRLCATTLFYIPFAAIRYRTELQRLLAQMGMGVGALAVIGGAVGVFFMIFLSTGALVGSEGYTQLQSLGVDALTGFAGALLNIRFIVPATAAVTLSATVGAGATAEVGAMRINEEIDALESMGIRSLAYLSSTRVIAGVVVTTPLYCVALLFAFLAARISTTVYYGQEPGVYDHYFGTFLNPTAVIQSYFYLVALAALAMLVHTSYGFTATGGPAGVGEAVGRAVRITVVIVCVALVLITLAAYGPSGGIHFAS